jgi:hypothetical protein
VNNFSNLIIDTIENLQDENKQLISNNKEILENYIQSHIELSNKEKEYLEVKNKLSNSLSKTNNENNIHGKSERSQTNTNKIKSTNDLNKEIASYFKLNYNKVYSEFQDKVKNIGGFDYKTSQEDIVILLEAIKLVQQQAKIDLNNELDKNDLDLLNKISIEYSLNDEEDDLSGDKIIDFIEKIVNNCHQTGKIKSVEITQDNNTVYKFDGVTAEFLLDNDNLLVKNDGNITFEDWLLKNFSTQKSKKIINNDDSNANNFNSIIGGGINSNEDRQYGDYSENINNNVHNNVHNNVNTNSNMATKEKNKLNNNNNNNVSNPGNRHHGHGNKSASGINNKSNSHNRGNKKK